MHNDWLQGETIELPDVNLRVYHRPAEHRDGAARQWVIFYHGACGNKDLWRKQYEAFQDYDLVFVDVRGQGASKMTTDSPPDFWGAVNDIDAIYEHFGIDKAILVGHSWGGNPMQEYTLLHPDRVAGLVIIGTWGQHRVRPKSEVIAQNSSAFIYRFIPWGMMSKMSGKACSHDPEVRKEVADGIYSSGRKVFLSLGFSAFKEVHDIDEYPGNPPMLLVRGSDDFPKSLSKIYEYLESKNPNAHQVVIDGVVHMPMLTATEAFNQALQEFFDQVFKAES